LQIRFDQKGAESFWLVMQVRSATFLSCQIGSN
jgi:hypothetical protein